jgi:hypothetical protein
VLTEATGDAELVLWDGFSQLINKLNIPDFSFYFN